MRKLAVLVVAVLTLAAVMASSASAAVEVRDGEGELCQGTACEVTLEGEFKVVESSNGSVHHRCDVEFTMWVYGSGEIDVWRADFSQGVSWQCQLGTVMFNDCDDVGLVGQIYAPGDAEYSGSADFQAVLGACFDTIQGYYQQGTVRLDINNIDFPIQAQLWSVVPSFVDWGGQPYSWHPEATLGLPSAELDISEVE